MSDGTGIRPGRTRDEGFTLVELLLVLAIIGFAVAVTIPLLAKSSKGHRLRTASRGVVSAGRYARSMAVLKQADMAVTFDLDRSRLSVELVSTASVDPDQAPDRSLEAAGATNSLADMARDEAGPDGAGGPQEFPGGVRITAVNQEELSQRFEKVTIAYVDVRGGDRYTKGKCSVLYRSNGRCTPYEVRLVGEDGATVTLEVDALASARAE